MPLATGGNVLMLDEPTNDLDVTTLRALEEAGGFHFSVHPQPFSCLQPPNKSAYVELKSGLVQAPPVLGSSSAVFVSEITQQKCLR
jgi:hypothetical protein